MPQSDASPEFEAWLTATQHEITSSLNDHLAETLNEQTTAATPRASGHSANQEPVIADAARGQQPTSVIHQELDGTPARRAHGSPAASRSAVGRERPNNAGAATPVAVIDASGPSGPGNRGNEVDPRPVGFSHPQRAAIDAAAELSEFADQIADQIESFLVVVRAVARGDAPDSAVPMLLLEVSQLLLVGGRLGAVQDVVPEERFEEDPGPDPEFRELREKLAELLEPCDNYRELFDPLAIQPELQIRRISDDIATAVSDLAHGLTHYQAGRTLEALWWWQFSYLTEWGPAASAAMRALQSIIARSRLRE